MAYLLTVMLARTWGEVQYIRNGLPFSHAEGLDIGAS